MADNNRKILKVCWVHWSKNFMEAEESEKKSCMKDLVWTCEIFISLSITVQNSEDAVIDLAGHFVYHIGGFNCIFFLILCKKNYENNDSEILFIFATYLCSIWYTKRSFLQAHIFIHVTVISSANTNMKSVIFYKV